jgi:hypothetical protein
MTLKQFLGVLGLILFLYLIAAVLISVGDY